MRQALSDAGLSTSEIDQVILVGGSTRIPAVQEAVRKETGKSLTVVLTLTKLLQWVPQYKVAY